MKSWKCIQDMFDTLHRNNCNYIILRNYEEIDADNFYISGHADIDFLTSERKKFVQLISAEPRFNCDDGIHYIVSINGTDVIIDIRTVGDGYYDTVWEKELLKKRQKINQKFYVTDQENYYYSLIYHSILQKKGLTDEYLQRLNRMANELGVKASTELEHLEQLSVFMKRKKYFYTVAYDIWVPLRKELIDQKRVKKGIKIYIRDLKTELLRLGSKLKHKIVRK